MYLPTFWKLTQEYRIKVIKRSVIWVLPVTFAAGWIMYHSFYNWVFTSIIPPPMGVQKREKKKI